MLKLKPSATLMAWTRGTGLWHPELGFAFSSLVVSPDALLAGDYQPLAERHPAFFDASPAEADRDAIAEVRASTWTSIDHAYHGWMPGLGDQERELLAVARQVLDARRIWTPPVASWPALPGSVVRRVLAIGAHHPETIYIDDDADGLSVVLAVALPGAKVTVRRRNPLVDAWLLGCANLFEVAGRLQWLDDDPTAAAFDVAVVPGGPPTILRRALTLGQSTLRTKGVLVSTIAAEWDALALDQAEACGWEWLSQVRECDHLVVPGGFVIDSARDLVLWRLPEKPAPAGSLPVATSKENLDAVPYAAADFYGLAAEKLGDHALDALAEALAISHVLPERGRALTKEANRQVLSWVDRDGNGLTAQLHPHDQHLLVTFLPYQADLIYAAHAAIAHTMGNQYTRVRPVLPIRHRQEQVVG